jgi:hypothetical protein
MPRYARLWTIGLVLAAVVALAVGAIVTVVMTKRLMSDDTAPTFRRGEWQPPEQTVLESSMRARPVPGWRTSVEDLGLPETNVFGRTDEPHVWSTPFIGAVGAKGYFLARSPGSPDAERWLVGLDVHTGKQLFAPVRIDAGPDFLDCFVNGPDSVLCISDAVREGNLESVAWAIDARTGSVLFNGPTKLHANSSNGPDVEQVGTYAVARAPGEGIYGIGPRTETTWFVPGVTIGTTKWTSDAAPPSLAAARDSVKGSDRMTVFSLIDGKVITPDLGKGLRPLTAVVYPGGFAFEATSDMKVSIPDVVIFFDDDGNHVGETKLSGFLSTLSKILPILESPDSTVFGANGAGLLQFPDQQLGQNARLIGHRLYAPESTWEGPVKVRRWRQFDLTTGQEGNACRPNMSGYVANDGRVGVFETVRYEITGATTFAMDLASCEKLWTTPVDPDSFHELWRIDNALVELSDDGKELHSLVAPA